MIFRQRAAALRNGRARAFFSGKGKDAGQPSGGFPGFPKGFDVNKVQELMKAPPDKQMEAMKKAIEMQKTLGKVPGLGRLATKNAEMMEKVMKMQEAAMKGNAPTPEAAKKLEEEVKKHVLGSSPGAPPPPPPPKGKGPTLDDLRKMNLGNDIEALFAELKSIRDKKNEYRDKFNEREKAFEDMLKETTRLRETEDNIRQKLQLAEKNVLLLNSENMELKAAEREMKELRAANQKLISRVNQLQQNDVAPLEKKIEQLEAELRAKDEAQRSLARKLERSRRRDPLIQFSQSCSSEPLKLAGSANGGVRTDILEQSFTAFKAIYEEHQQAAWLAAARGSAAAAKVMIAVATEVFLSRIPNARFDAMVKVEGNIATAKTFLAGMNFEVVAAGDKFQVTAPLEISGLGPFGFCAVAQLASPALGFQFVSVEPCISESLINNAKRCTVTYESCRSGGPGGQAANVSETQITARLSIDGDFVMQSEAQDSRSAVANKDSATEKLKTTRRQLWNDQASKFDVETFVGSLKSLDVPAASGDKMNEYQSFVDLGVSTGEISLAQASIFEALKKLR